MNSGGSGCRDDGLAGGLAITGTGRGRELLSRSWEEGSLKEGEEMKRVMGERKTALLIHSFASG